MNTRHWSDDQLLQRLYGVGPEDWHLDNCPECRKRWEVLVERRRTIPSPVEVNASFMALQRNRIHERLKPLAPLLFRLRPVALLSCLAVISLAAVLLRTMPQQRLAPQPVAQQQAANSDAQLLADIYSVLESREPSPVRTLHALFEEN